MADTPPPTPYITTDDINAAGFIVNDENKDSVIASIIAWAQFIELATGQFFESRAAEFTMDGNDSDTLFLPIPIIDCSAVYANSDMVNALNTQNYTVYNRRGPVQDDRKNPKIVWTTRFIGGFMPHVSARGQGCIFGKGYQNQKIVGNFGFVEADGSTPYLIKRALIRLVIRDLNNPDPMSSGYPVAIGKITSETTDGHTMQFGQLEVKQQDITDITKDQEISRILRMYKRPICIGVPGSMTWVMG